MSSFHKEIKYRCSDDCVQSGCPGHIAKMMYQSTSDILHFEAARCDVFFERGALDAFFKMFTEIAHARIELEGQIIRAYKELRETE